MQVSVFSINDATNSELFTPNDGSLPAVWAGLTKPLSSWPLIDVVSGAVYQVKIAIADVGDALFDSAVYLQTSSGRKFFLAWCCPCLP